MDQERARIQDDLRGLVAGDVRCDDIFLEMYASDASVYEIKPLGVVCPRHAADVVACVQYAGENDISIHARGAGTGLAGESLGRGLVLDFSRYMTKILEVGDDWVRVQPGVTLAAVNDRLRRQGRHFGPDPANAVVTTMGSVVAIDAAGSHWLKYGSARRHVRELQIVLADGTTFSVGREPLSQHATEGPARRRQQLVTELADLLLRKANIIKKHQPQSDVNRCGYQLHDVLAEGHLDLAKLLAGSEGTLALITEATLATQPLAKHRGVALLMFDRLENAALAVAEILPLGVTACDLMDRRHVSLARESDVRYDLLIPSAAEAVLLVECEADEPDIVRGQLKRITTRVRHDRRLAFDTRQTLDAEEIQLYQALSQEIVARLNRLQGSTRPVPFVEDVAVPPSVLPEFLVKMQNIFKQHEVTASLFAHAGHGQLHIRPFLDLSNPKHIWKMGRVANDLNREVLEVGGTLSGEHGDGLSRTWFLHEQYGPLYEVFREVKRVFDPRNIFNPGKIVGDDPFQLTRNLRHLTPAAAPPREEHSLEDVEPAELIPLQLTWDMRQINDAARSCNGCGVCRTEADTARMCPIFRNGPREEASPRAKANLMRAILTGRLPPETCASDDFKAIADLCVNCHSCRLECPASVDIPQLMVEAKGQYVATNGLRPSDWFMTRLDLLASIGSLARPLVNRALANRQMRWLLEKLTGIAQGRKLPQIARRNFLRRAARRRLDRPSKSSGRKVLYFVDTYANYFDPQLGEALVAVLRHNGVSVYVPTGQQQAGMPLVTLGALERARAIAARNVELLAEAVRQGFHILATEPAAALCLTHDYPALLDDDEARLVADHTSEACSYLWKMHQQGKLQLDFQPVSATLGYHMPCHLKALGVGSPGENLLRLIPGLTVIRKEKGCSGMAGTFGLLQRNYRSSLRAGWGLISALRDPTLTAGATECSTCKIQMEQGTTKPTAHPIKVLALAYGLMPELTTLLSRHGQELVVT